MGKKRRGAVNKEKIEKVDNAVKSTIKSIHKKFGSGSACKAHNEIGVVKNWISIHPLIDGITGGGIPCGKFTAIGGQSWAGKTLILSHAISNAINSGGYAVIFNTENAINVKQIITSMGIDESKLIMVPNPDSGDESSEIPSIEKCYEMIKHMCKERIKNNDTDIPLFIGIDSLSQTLLENEVEEAVGEQTSMMGIRQKIIKQGGKHINPFLRKANVAVVITAQMISNRDKYGPRMIMSDANAIEYVCDLVIQLKRGITKTRIEKDKKIPIRVTGNRIIVKKSRVLTAPVGGEVVFDVSFKEGIIAPAKKKKKDD